MKLLDRAPPRLRHALSTKGQVFERQREKWERKKSYTPDYAARELLSDSRGFFSQTKNPFGRTKEEPFTSEARLTKMDAFLARHASMQRASVLSRGKSPQLVVNRTSAKKDLELRMRKEGLTFLERCSLRRSFSVTIDRLQREGARKSWGKLHLTWEQKRLYQYGYRQRRDAAKLLSTEALQFLDRHKPEATPRRGAPAQWVEIKAETAGDRRAVKELQTAAPGLLQRSGKSYAVRVDQIAKVMNRDRWRSIHQHLTDVGLVNTKHPGYRLAVERSYYARHGLQQPTLNPVTLRSFERYGSVEKDGTWRIAASRIHTRKALVSALDKAATQHPEQLRFERGHYVLSAETVRTSDMEGTANWARTYAAAHSDLSRQVAGLNVREADFLRVTVKGDEARGVSPLSPVSPSTAAVYSRTARRMSETPLQERPAALAERAEQLSSSAWWQEHALLRRQIRSAEQAAHAAQNKELARELYRLRLGVERMHYARLRGSEQQPKAPNPARAPVRRETLTNLKDELLARGDTELHDALVIAEHTGLRPAELQAGVQFERVEGGIAVHITGAKKQEGQAGAARFQADKGQDRILEINSPELEELALRRGGSFRPESSAAALRWRLARARNAVPGAQKLSLYSFRHRFATDLRDASFSRQEIAQALGHTSTRSQSDYGTLR